MDRFAHLIVAAARQAEADSGLEVDEGARPGRRRRSRPGSAGSRPSRTATTSCSTAAPTASTRSRSRRSSRTWAPRWVSMELGTKGPLSSQCTACAASNMSIGDGMDAIRLGRADVMLCGGTEAPMTTVGIAGFGAMRALSRRNDAPEQASPAVRRGPRRLRHGRGRRDPRPRGARARAGPRREDLRGAARLRALLRRDAHHRARPDRREPGARDDDGVRRRGHRAVARSATSTRTAPRRRSATRARRA